MPYNNKTNAEYKNSYEREKYDRVVLLVPKGEKDEFKKIAQTLNESVNQFIYKSIIERIARIESEQNRE